jgi:benzoyl-CoA reductase subunit A
LLVAGIDIGSHTSKALILNKTEIKSWGIMITGPDSKETSNIIMKKVLNKAHLEIEDIDFRVSTGYGRINVPYADKQITEISCHAKGANWLLPSTRTILDMGGQDCKAIRCDQEGRVVNFVMNDKCAAGAGRSMEIMGKILDVPLEKIGELAVKINNNPVSISSKCTVFAKSEVISLARNNIDKKRILAGICDALADRVHSLLNRVGIEEDFVISGGIAKNKGVIKSLEKKIGIKPNICFEPQIVGALGAALFANEIISKSIESEKVAAPR